MIRDFDSKIKHASKLVAQGRVSRRDFMQLALAAGLTAAAANTLFVRAARAEPKKGGTFKIGIGHGATTDTLDPATWTNGFQFDMSIGVFGAQLTHIDQKTSIVPHLAETIEPADGANKWVFKLRKGSTFHNGKTLTANDVVETYNYHRGENSKSAIKSALAIVTDIKADGPETVIFTLNSGSADFPYITSDYHLPIYPAKDGGGIEWEKGISAGPYILENYEPGVKADRQAQPQLSSRRRRLFRRCRDARHRRCHRAHQRAQLRRDPLHRPRRSQDHRHAQAESRISRSPISPGFGHYVAPMNVTRGAVRQCRCPAGAQMGDRPQGDRRQDPARLRHAGQRQSDRAVDQIRHQSAAGLSATIRRRRSSI